MINSFSSKALTALNSLKWPFGLALLAGFLTALYSLTLPDYYRSEARLLPVESKAVGGNLGGLASAAAAFGVSVPGSEGSDANFVDILNSRWLREKLLQSTFQFHERTWRFGPAISQSKTLFNYLEARNLDQGIVKLAPLLAVSRDPKSKVITLSAETTSPELSQLMVGETLNLLEIFNREKGRTRGGAKVLFAEARLHEARKEMDEAEDAFRRFLEANRNYLSSSDPATRLRGIRLETELRLRQQLVSSISMTREQSLMEEKNDMPILNLLDASNLPFDKSRPSRANMVVWASFFTGLCSWAWLNRERLRAIVG